ncbi:MAG: cupin domain-containing protein [Planctomycetes bacterium]|nr:cupin domain-containing protein [Planctomycetota bacterium]
MSDPPLYVIRTDVRFGPLERMDVGEIERSCTHPWYNETLCRVNDCVVRLGVLHGEFHWHAHEREDEFFHVVRGRLLIDVEGKTIELAPGQGVVVPRGTLHRPRAPERTVVLMMEGATVTPTGDQ